MSRIFQMFTSPSNTVEDNESDEQEQVTASPRPIHTTDVSLDETTQRPRHHSSNSSQDELSKKLESNLPVTSLKKKKATSLMKKYLFMSLQMLRMGTSHHVLSQTFQTEIECFQLCIKREVN